MANSKTILQLVLGLVLLSGCAYVPKGYSKPNATRQAFLQARYECMKDATFLLTYSGALGNLKTKQQINCETYKNCMEMREFNRVANGTFTDSNQCDH